MVALLLCLAAGPAVAELTDRVSLTSGGSQGDDTSDSPAVSADGRFVAFASCANNLVAGDTNALGDVFVRDRQTGTTERVSVGAGGTQGNDASDSPTISADGRFVAFVSCASNLVTGDTNRFCDIFVRDRQIGTTERVSVATGGAQSDDDSDGPSISADGRFVAFWSFSDRLVSNDTNLLPDVFVRDRQAGTTERVSIASGGGESNGSSSSAAISADGRFVAFVSCASNLVAGDTNGLCDIFVRDRQGGRTERVSVASGGAQANGNSSGPAVSADGRFVAFWSYASNLVLGDTNNVPDVFVRDWQTGTTERVSVASSGAQGNGFSSTAVISADGQLVAFASCASNLVAGDTNALCDVFIRDRQAGTTQRLSVASDGTQGNGASGGPAMSADGHLVAFDSTASDLVPSDSNLRADVFVRRPSCGDGALDIGEQCDDGNTVNGDCCSSACQVEPRGTTCPDEGNPCTSDQCDGAGACVHPPIAGCSTTTTTTTATMATTTTLPFGGDDPGCVPATQNRLKCGETIVKAAAKLFKAVDKCHCKQAKDRFTADPAANANEEMCEESNAGKAAKEKYDATKTKLVSLGICTATQLANMDMLRDDLLAYLDGARNADIYCDGSTPIGDDDMGNVPSGTDVLGCECSAGKNAAKLYAAALKCHFKNADSVFKQKVPPFDEEACEETAGGKGAHDKYTAAAAKLIAKGICPPCLDSAPEHEALATADLGVAESNNDKPYPCE